MTAPKIALHSILKSVGKKTEETFNTEEIMLLSFVHHMS